MEKVAILYNPTSGRGKSIKFKKMVEGSFKFHHIPYELFVTNSESHLRDLSRKKARDCSILIGVGGDTTLNIIVSELLEEFPESVPGKDQGQEQEEGEGRPIVGMIGTGSANDIVKALGMTSSDSLCHAIKQRNTRGMDVGRLKIKGRQKPVVFLGTLSAGLGTTINQYIEAFNQKHRWLAASTFISQVIMGLSGIHRSFSQKKVPLKVNLEFPLYGSGMKNSQGSRIQIQSMEVEFSLLVFMNIGYYANGMKLCPHANPFDGILDCCIINTSSFVNTLQIGMKVPKGTHVLQEEVRFLESDSFRVSCPEGKDMDIQVDGEVIQGVGEFELSVIPNCIQVLV
jgi:diacylglycerol kinase family enzyme